MGKIVSDLGNYNNLSYCRLQRPKYTASPGVVHFCGTDICPRLRF